MRLMRAFAAVALLLIPWIAFACTEGGRGSAEPASGLRTIDLRYDGGTLRVEVASTPDERAAAAAWLVAMAEVCPVLLVRGNHDRRRDCALLARLTSKHPIIVEEGASVHHIGGAAIAAMAWPDRANLAANLA